MDFIDRIHNISKKITQVSDSLTTEEATKNALIMPFLQSILGYDVFNPKEVIPEFNADQGTKKGEKVDYALVKDGEIQIIVECKKYGDKLSSKHASQLFRYFTVTNTKLAILTNGAEYQFYTDLDEPNKMDEKPFLILDLENIDDHIVPEIKKLTREIFDPSSIVDAAGELKYLNEIKKVLAVQFKKPDEDFVKFFASKVYDGVLTPKVKAQFLLLTSKALVQFLNESINNRLQSAIGSNIDASADQKTNNKSSVAESQEDEQEPQSKIHTTEEEIEGFNIIKAILRQKFEVHRITHRDTQSYFGVLLDDNNRKPLCRLHFNAKQKYLGIFDADRVETRHPIESVDNIFDFNDQLISTTLLYE
mgnify:CR=1 FL=1